jgi:hypothetical protein
MRSALNSWRDSVGDFSETTELQMANQFWPNGEQPITQPPKISINQLGIATIAPAANHDSIGYRINGGAWMIYKAPVSVPKGGVLEAKAVRYGWAESTLVKVSG